MKKIILLIMFVSPISLTAFGQTLNRCDYKDNKKDKRIEEEMKLARSKLRGIKRIIFS